MQTKAITAEQYSITVTEHGYAVAVSEQAAQRFDDVMARPRVSWAANGALLDQQARDTLLTGTCRSSIQHPVRDHLADQSVRRRYRATAVADFTTGGFYLRPAAGWDAIETLATRMCRGRRDLRVLHPSSPELSPPRHARVHRGDEDAPGNFACEIEYQPTRSSRDHVGQADRSRIDAVATLRHRRQRLRSR
jgi:hypothetical protein